METITIYFIKPYDGRKPGQAEKLPRTQAVKLVRMGLAVYNADHPAIEVIEDAIIRTVEVEVPSIEVIEDAMMRTVKIEKPKRRRTK